MRSACLMIASFVFVFAYGLFLGSPQGFGQFTEPERITALESDMRNVKDALERIENKIGDVDDKLDGIGGDAPADAKEDSILDDRLLEILLIVIVGADKAAYWRKRRNGTWMKGDGKTLSEKPE